MHTARLATSSPVLRCSRLLRAGVWPGPREQTLSVRSSSALSLGSFPQRLSSSSSSSSSSSPPTSPPTSPPSSHPLSFFQRAQQHAQRPAIRHEDGTHFSYARLLADAAAIAKTLLHQQQLRDLAGQRIAFLSPPTYDYVAMKWGIWLAGGVAVPLSPHHTAQELAYFTSDSQASMALAHSHMLSALAPLQSSLKVLPLSPSSAATPSAQSSAVLASLPAIEHARDALIIYTSGTTGKPKGVVSTHGNVESQVRTLVESWEWRKDDVIYNVLPLHHVHGAVNVVGCALFAGACVEMPPRFDAAAVLNRFLQGGLTLFMAVPTVYSRLLMELQKLPMERQKQLKTAMSKLRLMVSGSAALPVPLLHRWEEASGHRLLERYGMTELGMALSNPLRGPRLPGRVGQPLPGVEVKLSGAADDGNGVISGELRVRGPSVFSRYWNRPEATAESFDEQGFFKTGDIAAYDAKLNSYAILGRASVDIIKSGGYKISALEIEPVVLSHPAVRECAVVGVPDEQWGERIVAVIGLHTGQSLTLEELRSFCKKELAPYKLPSAIQIVAAIPRNALGKVNKKELVKSLLDKK